MNKELPAALGLDETATEAEAPAVIKSLNAAKPRSEARHDTPAVDLAAYAPRADLNALEARALAAEKQLAELNAAGIRREAETAVDEAIKNRKIAPANREEYLAFCATKEGLEKMKISVTIQSLAGDSGNRRNEGAFSPEMSRLGAKGGGSPLC